MKNIDGLQQLPQDAFDLGPFQWLVSLRQSLEQCCFAVLKDAMNLVRLGAKFFEDVQEPDEVGVLIQLFEDRNLPHRRIVDPVRHVLEQERLQRHQRVRFCVHALRHFTVGSFTQYIDLAIVAELRGAEGKWWFGLLQQKGVLLWYGILGSLIQYLHLIRQILCDFAVQ